MTRKFHSKEEIDSPDGKAPSAAWQAVESQVRRPEDVWVAGDPSLLLEKPNEWIGRLEVPTGAVGLRARFVVSSSLQENLNFSESVGRLLRVLKDVEGALFFHAEMMEGPESGIYFAYENRLPALLTQAHFQDGECDGALGHVSPGPLHINIVLHDPNKTFASVAEDGSLLRMVQSTLALGGKDLEPRFVRELTLGRSNTPSDGVSVGLENMRQIKGAQGGFYHTPNSLELGIE